MTKKITLGGDWSLRDATGGDAIAARVPGCVHVDLLAAGRIPDPWVRDNEKLIDWIWRRDWVFERSFVLEASFLAEPRVRLRCEGLDTLATIEVNGVAVLAADNMHRRWEVEVRARLRSGENQIRVTFSSPETLMREKDAERRLSAWNIYSEAFRGRNYVRKMACAFGWDWGLVAPTAGIWRGIGLEAFGGRIEDLRVSQEHGDGRVALRVFGEIAGGGNRVGITVSKDGAVVAAATHEAAGGLFDGELTISDPRLWWPNGLGDQPLYEVRVELRKDDRVLHATSRRVGLRTLELVRERDEFGESFRFRVNGMDFFAKGANWIPCDVFPSRVSDGTYGRLLDSAAAAHFNMIRVWGGGIYEDDRFYDRCDELGLLVWQDFMFACGAYPTSDEAFCDNIRAEAVDNVRRLRHHPCLALWCGNNEMEQAFVAWDASAAESEKMSLADYTKVFDGMLADVVREHDGATSYWPGSPHTPGENRADHNDETIGDAHTWSVWFGGESFEAQRKWNHRFISEFGFQSFPEPRTVEEFTDPADRQLNSWIMDFHQRSAPGNNTIFRYLLDWFLPPKSFEDSLWMTQIVQAMCVQYAVEHARRIQGRMDGLLFWQLNDLWPGATWSSIDVAGRWKALQFFAKRFFEPVHVSLLESMEASTMAIHVSNHRPTSFSGSVSWELTTGAGEVLASGALSACVPSQSNVEVGVLDFARFRDGSAELPLSLDGGGSRPREADRNLLLWAWLDEADGREVSNNCAYFAKPKYLDLRVPTVSVDVRSIGEDRFELTLRSDFPAPWTQLELTTSSGDFDDNFFHLHPRRDVKLVLRVKEPTNAERVSADLRIKPLMMRSLPD